MEVDWERLSPRGAAILRQIAVPRSEGLLLVEIAVELGISRSLASPSCVSSRTNSSS
jgi:hypothetical protein